MDYPRIETRRYPGGVARHRHDAHHQVVLPLGASRMEMEVGGRGGRIDRAGFAVLAAGQVHDFEAPAGDTFLIADLPPLPGELWERSATRPFLPLDPALGGFAALLAEACPGGGSAVGPEAADMLTAALARRFGAAPLPERLSRAIALMRRDLAVAHRIARVARATGTSERRLHAAFRNHLGMSPMAWLTAQRMAEARRLLCATALPVSEIAARVGYDEPSAFARAFRRATGEAPMAFRTRHRAAERQDRHG